jgi:hypothetical protein
MSWTKKQRARHAIDRRRLQALIAAEERRARDVELALRIAAALFAIKNRRRTGPTYRALKALGVLGPGWLAEARRLAGIFDAAVAAQAAGWEPSCPGPDHAAVNDRPN